MTDSRSNRSISSKFNEWTGQPVFWAAIASLGLHGILFAALPSFSSSASDFDSQRTVAVVELGADELNRLPDSLELDRLPLPDVEENLYDLDLESLENLDDLEDLDDLLSELGLEETEPVIPKSPGLLSPLPRSPLLPPPVQRPRTTLPAPTISWPFSNRTPIPVTPTNPTPLPTPVQPTPTPDQPTPTPNQPTPLGPTGLQPENPNIAVRELEENDADASGDPSGSPDGESTPGNLSPDPDVDPTPLTREQREAALVARLLAENQQRQDAIAYRNGFEQIPELFNAWRSQSADDNLSLEEDAPFPLEACAAGQDAQVRLGVLVGKNNKLLNRENIPNPVFMQVSAQEFLSEDGPNAGASFDVDAYSILDDKALEVVQTYPYETADGANQKSRYWFTVNFTFDEDDCSQYLAKQAAEQAAEQAQSSPADAPTANESTPPPDESPPPQSIPIETPAAAPGESSSPSVSPDASPNANEDEGTSANEQASETSPSEETPTENAGPDDRAELDSTGSDVTGELDSEAITPADADSTGTDDKATAEN